MSNFVGGSTTAGKIFVKPAITSTNGQAVVSLPLSAPVLVLPQLAVPPPAPEDDTVVLWVNTNGELQVRLPESQVVINDN